MISESQSGVVRKHVALVSNVTKIAAASFPPVRCVHTAADAKVQGATDATTTPVPNSPVNNRDTPHAIKGNSPIFTAEPNSAAQGRWIVCATTRVSSGKAIKNNTEATIALRSTRNWPAATTEPAAENQPPALLPTISETTVFGVAAPLDRRPVLGHPGIALSTRPRYD